MAAGEANDGSSPEVPPRNESASINLRSTKRADTTDSNGARPWPLKCMTRGQVNKFTYGIAISTLLPSFVATIVLLTILFAREQSLSLLWKAVWGFWTLVLVTSALLLVGHWKRVGLLYFSFILFHAMIGLALTLVALYFLFNGPSTIVKHDTHNESFAHFLLSELIGLVFFALALLEYVVVAIVYRAYALTTRRRRQSPMSIDLVESIVYIK